jgi:glycosyltransferase involved in cell wall biosynthesis
MKTLLVSVIVPVYNVEKYLSQCLDSIIGQRFTDYYECILVDDGSTDCSGAICDKYARQYPQIKVIHKTNGGLSDARNAGLDEARGYYVIFIDSDDYWIDQNVLQNLVSLFQNQDDSCDFINFNRIKYYQNKNIFRKWARYSDEAIKENTKKDKIIALIRQGQFPMSACLKIIKKNFLIDNNIRFINGLTSEDIPWFFAALKCSKNFLLTNEFYYINRKQVSTSISSTFSEKRYSDISLIVENTIIEIEREYFENNELKNALFSFVAYYYSMLMGMACFFNSGKRKIELQKLKEKKWLLQCNLHPKVRFISRILRITGFHITAYLLYFWLRFNGIRK